MRVIEFVKKLMIAFLAIIMLGVGTLQGATIGNVYANEEEDEEADTSEGGTPGRSENILENIGADAEVLGRVKTAMSYNEQMHYLMTYTILRGTYMDTGGYSDIYLRGTYGEGAGEGKSITIRSGNSNVLMSIKGDGGGHHENTPENPNDGKYEEREKAIKALADKITESFVEKYIEKFYLTDKEMPDGSLFKKGKRISIVPNITLRGGAEPIKNNKGNFKKGQRYDLIGEEINKVVQGYLRNKEFEKINLYWGINREVSKEYEKKHSEYYLEAELQTVGGVDYVIRGKKGDTTADRRRTVRMIPYKGGRFKSTGATTVFDNSGGKDYNATFSSENRQWEIKFLEDVMKTSEYKSYEKAMKDFDDDVGAGESAGKEEGISGLGWMPLDMFVPAKVREDKVAILEKKYTEVIKIYDGGMIVDGGRVEYAKTGESYTGKRAVRVNDLINMPIKTESKNKTSASPYFTYKYDEFKNRDIGGAFVGKSSIQLGSGLSQYAGMKVEKVSPEKFGDYFSGKNVAITEPLTSDDITGNQYKLYPHKIISSMNTDVKNIGNVIGENADYTMGIDNYGNIISGATLGVMIPYWHNTEVKEFKDFNTDSRYFLSTPIMNQNSIADITGNAYRSGAGKGEPWEQGATLSGLGKWKGDVSSQENFLKGISGYTGSISSFKEGVHNNRVPNTQALAMAIVSKTKGPVEAYNKKFVESAVKHGELYLEPSDGGRGDGGNTDGNALEKFSAADLLEKIAMILDIGFYELIRLTIVSWVVSFYTATVSNFALSSVFHTSLITDTALWGELIRTVSLLLIAFMGVYILYMAYKMLRGTMQWKDFVRQFLMVTMVLVIPTVIYSPLVNFTINKPTEKIVGKQMEQMSLLDAYLEKVKEERKDEKYSRLFGSVDTLRSRSDDYLIDFYTTQHVEGFDITNVSYEELSVKNQFRNINNLETGKWRKNDLVRVKVSIFDLFKWVESGDDVPLFQWLETEFSDKNKYIGVGKYDEFKTSTAVKYPTLGVNIEGEEWTASELYKRMYLDTADKQVMENISGLFKVTEVFRNRGQDIEMSKITDYEKESLIRDLAMTAKSRETVYGDGRAVSPNTMDLLGKYGGGVGIPTDDFLGLSAIVDKLVPYRDSTTTTLDEDVYNINKSVIDNYISNMSIVRETVGDNNDDYRFAEFHMVVMDMWFQLNKALDLPMFPRTYEVDTISFDSYMRLAYIPMQAFSNIEDKELDNVSEYLALREHPVTLVFGFLPALGMLVAFGMIYIAVFYVVMLIAMVLAFIYNNIIKKTRNAGEQDKSMLGSLVIILTMAMAKIGLLVIWKAMSYILNYQTVMKGGTPYPYGFIHSLVICVYLFVVIKFIFARLLKAVWKDKANLGGGEFHRMGKDFVERVQEQGKRLRGLSNIPDKAVGKAGDLAKTAGQSVATAIGLEGAKGKLMDVAGGFSVGALKELASRRGSNKKDIEMMQEALESTGEVPLKDRYEQRFGKSVKGLFGLVGGRALKDYDGIGEGSEGLTPEMQADLEESGGFGQVLSTTDDGSNITTMNTGSETEANQIVEHLKTKGLQAYANGTEVHFNSDGYDLENASVRKGLFGGLVDKLFDEVDEDSKPVETEVKGAYNYTDIEGKKGQPAKYSIGVGSDGIDTGSLDAVINSESFKENFAVISKPVKKDGEYLQGSMQVVSRNKDVKIEDVMQSMYKVDDTMRNIKGREERQELRYSKAIEVTDKEFKGVKNLLAEGMRIQDGKILYDEENEEHVKSAEDITKSVKKNRDRNQSDKANMIMRLASHVTKGGNAGFEVETVNSKENEEVYQTSRANGLINDKVVTTAFGGNKVKEVATNIEQMRNVINASSGLLDTYSDTRHNLYQIGEDVLMKDVGNNPDKALNVMARFAESNGVKVEEIMGRYKKFGDDRKNSNITEADYSREVEGLIFDMQEELQGKGKYDQLMTETLRKDLKKIKGKKGKQSLEQKELKESYEKILDGYAESRVKLKEQGVDISTVEKFSRQDFDRVGQLIGDIEKVEAKEDGRIVVDSYSRLDEGDVNELMGLMTGEGLIEGERRREQEERERRKAEQERKKEEEKK